MKKLFAILAAAFVVVACGGGAEKDEPKTIEDQLLGYIAKMEKAVEAGDVEAASAATEAFEKWGESLDEEQLTEVFEAYQKHEDRIMKVALECEALIYGPEYCDDLGCDCYEDEYDYYY